MPGMDSRERVFLALNHEEPDRVPIDFWASSGACRVITEATGMTQDEFLDAHDVDFRYIEGPAYVGVPLEPGVDIWGVRRKTATVRTRYGYEVYSEVDVSPLNSLSIEEIERYSGWPDPDDFDYTVVRAQAEEVRRRGRVVVFMGDRLNRVAQLKPAMYLRGVEGILTDLAASPGIAKVIFDRIVSFYKEYLLRILDAADGLIDIVLTGDDFGRQRGLLISPAMWDDYLAPGFSAYIEIIRGFNAKSMHHTCGDVRLLAARMHEIGLDILQSLQPEAMDDAHRDLKNDLGKTMSFHGGISIQRTLPHGDARDIDEEVRERVRTLGPEGGYFLCTAHNIQADCPYRNIAALFDAYAAHGAYRPTAPTAPTG